MEKVKVKPLGKVLKEYFVTDGFIDFINSVEKYTINEVEKDGKTFIDVVYFDDNNFIKLKRFFLKKW